MPRNKNNKQHWAKPYDPPKVRSQAPQAAPHRRGGTHGVKDEDKTGTVYDTWNYQTLKEACISRKVYVKDMKKAEMMRVLANYDEEKRRAERQVIAEHDHKQRELAKEKKREEERLRKLEDAKRRKRMEKKIKRDRDESVSEDTPDEDELERMHKEMLGLDSDDDAQGVVGKAVSEEFWDSTSSESSENEADAPIVPSNKLRIFEWTYASMPSPTIRDYDVEPERVPHRVHYTSFKVFTTESKEKMFLPGQTYPPNVDHDFVPALTKQTRIATRNGVLLQELRKATIEPAMAWADRTLIQGHNARMFFTLPPANEEKRLADIYTKWSLEDRKTLRVKPKGDVEAVNRAKRHEQRQMNKVKRQAEVLEASEYRPLALCYLPAYLDYDTDRSQWGLRTGKMKRTLENLFFIRFPGCDVPHYYFWTRQGQWEDPTNSNPDFDANQDVDMVDWDEVEEDEFPPQLAEKQPPRCKQMILVREKKSIPPPPPFDAFRPKHVARIEHELIVNGLAHTLSKYRTKWLAEGKRSAWEAFSYQMPRLYPSGQIPTAPPVQAERGVNVATKLACIEAMGSKTLMPPFTGDEPWTSNDDVWWDVVEIEVDGGEIKSWDEAALFRRCSMPSPGGYCTSWLELVSPSYAPLTPTSVSGSPMSQALEARVREEWEERFLETQQRGMDVLCPFCLESMGDWGLAVSPHFC